MKPQHMQFKVGPVTYCGAEKDAVKARDEFFRLGYHVSDITNGPCRAEMEGT